MIDAFWDTKNHAGAGVVWYDYEHKIKEILLSVYMAGDAFHSEAMALLMAVQQCQLRNDNVRSVGYTIFTDCEVLVNQLYGEGNQEFHSWRAAETILQIHMLIRLSTTSIQVKHAHREYMKDAHTMANTARRQRINYKGTHINVPWAPEGLQEVWNHNAFKVVHDDGG
jgi:Reverse transcriptase-like